MTDQSARPEIARSGLVHGAVQGTPVAAPGAQTAVEDGTGAARRAHVRRWLARNRRLGEGVSGGVLGGVLLAPLLGDAAEAQGAVVPVAALRQVIAAERMADGSLRLTLADGRVVQVAAEDVVILADGTVAVRSAAVEALLAGTDAGAEAGGAAGGAALGAALGAGALLAGAAAGGGSGGAVAGVGAVRLGAETDDAPAQQVAYSTEADRVVLVLTGTEFEDSFEISASEASRLELRGDLKGQTPTGWCCGSRMPRRAWPRPAP